MCSIWNAMIVTSAQVHYCYYYYYVWNTWQIIFRLACNKIMFVFILPLLPFITIAIVAHYCVDINIAWMPGNSIWIQSQTMLILLQSCHFSELLGESIKSDLHVVLTKWYRAVADFPTWAIKDFISDHFKI